MTRPDRRFWIGLGVIAAGSLLLRYLYVGLVAGHMHGVYDNAFYTLEARALSLGRGFTNPFPFAQREPAADHPPLTAIILTPVPFLFGDGLLWLMRYQMATLGAVVVGVVGILGRRLGGDVTGLIAAGLTAVYPNIWVNDSVVMSETPATLLTALAVLLAYALLQRPNRWRAALLGVCAGLAALTRAELLLLVPFLGLGVPMVLRSARASTRLQLAAIGVLVPAFIVGPWIGYNLIRFEKPVLISANEGLVLEWANCPGTYSGPALGLIVPECRPVRPAHGDESVWSAESQSKGVTYVRAHLGQVPEVVAARVGRGWSLFRPTDMLGVGTTEGRPRWVTGLGLVFYYPLLLLAIGGVFVLARRRATFWPLLVPPVIVTITFALTWGQTRFRAPAEVSLVVLAAVAVERIVRAATDGRRLAPVRDPETV